MPSSKGASQGWCAAATHSLQLLDTCVKNCGMAFRLQIATRDFLNGLVRRFPESPPTELGRNRRDILRYIRLWHLTIAADPRFRDYFHRITEMHNLLRQKGYMFPHVTEEEINVLKVTKELRTADEMEKDDTLALKAVSDHARCTGS